MLRYDFLNEGNGHKKKVKYKNVFFIYIKYRPIVTALNPVYVCACACVI